MHPLVNGTGPNTRPERSASSARRTSCNFALCAAAMLPAGPCRNKWRLSFSELCCHYKQRPSDQSLPVNFSLDRGHEFQDMAACTVFYQQVNRAVDTFFDIPDAPDSFKQGFLFDQSVVFNFHAVEGAGF